MKPFSERNQTVIGAVGLALTFGIVFGSLNYDRLPFLQGSQYSAYFAEVGGLQPGKAVRVSGFEVGQVKSIEVDGPRALVTFTVDSDIRLGDRTEAAIKTEGLLGGTKILEVTSRGEGKQEGTIPLDRTTSPYELPDALGELATAISGLNTNQLSDSLRVLSETFSDTPPELRVAIEGGGAVLRHAQPA